MSRVIFKELLIADIENKVAKVVRFTDGKNLLTSLNNHVGKSLICKSLYYTLGAEVFFSDAWKRANSLYWLIFDIDGKEYKIVRKNFIFTIYEPNGNTVKLFRVKRLTAYLNGRKLSLFYHLGCYGEDFVEKSLRAKQLEDEQVLEDRESEDCQRIVAYLQDLLDKNGEILADETELAEKIKQNKARFDSLLLLLEKLKSEIIKLENEKTLAFHTKEQMEHFLKKEGSQRKSANNVQCPQCGCEFSIDFRERFEHEYLLENLAVELSKVSVEISTCQEKIEKKNKEYVEARNALALLEKNISLDEDLYNKYIKIKSAQSLIQENTKRIGVLSLSRVEREKCRKLLLKELQRYKNSAETAECLYKYNLSLLFAELNVSAEEVNANNYSIGDEIAASGAYKDRVILAKYYAFLITKLKLANQLVSFPIVIDSPRGDEQDKENAKIIMDFILADKRIDNQVIVATIEGNEFASEGTSVNVIDLKNEKHKLLSGSVYAQYEQSILAALANLSE